MTEPRICSEQVKGVSDEHEEEQVFADHRDPARRRQLGVGARHA
jgi:hypothetical protein